MDGSPQCSKRKELFKPLPARTPFIQVLNLSVNHWIIVSNVSKEGGFYIDRVCIYDSLPRRNVHHSIVKQICYFFKPPLRCETKFDGFDCGVFALACATELAFGCDPVLCEWDVKNMRHHLIECLENGSIAQFPTNNPEKPRHIGLGKRILNTVPVNIYCESDYQMI